MLRRRFQTIKSGFLLIELLIAVLIGLIIISALMRMQATLCELHETFVMRVRALGVAVNLREQMLSNKQESAKKLIKLGQREFTYRIDNLGANCFVEWRSITGRRCCLEL